MTHHDLGGVLVAGEGQNFPHHVLAVQGGGFTAQLTGQTQGLNDFVLVGGRDGGAGFHGDGDPIGVAVFRRAVGDADQTVGIVANAQINHHALAGGPRTGDGVSTHVIDHLRVDPFGGATQRQFAQSGQIAGSEEVVDGQSGLFGHIDLAFVQALDQLVRGQIDQFDLIGLGQNLIGQGFADLDAGNLLDDVVQAFQMLDVQGGEHVDARGQQFVHVLPAFQVARAGHVAVGQLVHQRQFGTPRQQGVQIHFLEGAAAIVDLDRRKDRHPLQKPFGFAAAMGFDDAGDHVDAVAHALARGFQHGIGLANARSRPKKDLKAASGFALRLGQQCVGRGAKIFGVVVHNIGRLIGL